MIRIINHREAQSLIARKTQRLEDAERIVAPILEDVRREGDAALLAYARKFDGFEGASVRIPVHGSLEPEFGRAVRIADANIREYARLQLPVEKLVEYPDGRKLEDMRMLLEGAINALGKVGLMLNVEKKNLESVLGVLPALKKPTISPLSDGDWLALNTILDEATVRTIIPRLKEAGAQGIVEYPLNKIVM